MGTGTGTMPVFTATGFDLTLTSLFVPVCHGGCCRLIQQERPEEALCEIFALDPPVSAIKLTPSHVMMMEGSGLTPARIGTVMLGGEAVTQAHLAVLREYCPDARIINEYGPTETTIGVVAGDMLDDVAIGRPYAAIPRGVRAGRPSWRCARRAWRANYTCRALVWRGVIVVVRG